MESSLNTTSGGYFIDMSPLLNYRFKSLIMVNIDFEISFIIETVLSSLLDSQSKQDILNYCLIIFMGIQDPNVKSELIKELTTFIDLSDHILKEILKDNFNNYKFGNWINVNVIFIAIKNEQYTG